MPGVIFKNKGFTLIELVIVIVLIGILAAVAVPRFHNMKYSSEAASIRGTLGNVRSAISVWRANALLYSPVAAWPDVTNLTTPNTNNSVLDTPIPTNPWATTPNNTVRNANNNSPTNRPATNTEGWAYDPVDGEFWANTSVNRSGETTSENTW